MVGTSGSDLPAPLRRDGLDNVNPFTRESLALHLQRHFRTWRMVRTNFGLTMYGVGREKLS